MNLSLSHIISLIAIFQLIVFIIFLFSKKFQRIPNRLLATFLILQAIICFNFLVKSYVFQPHEFVFYFMIIGDPAYWLVSPILYFYVRSLCYSNFNFRVRDLLHAIPFFAIFLFILISFLTAGGRSIVDSYYFKGISWKNNVQFYLSFLMYSQFLTYNILSLIVISEYRKRLKTQVSSVHNIFLTWLKFVIIGFMVAWIVNLSVNMMFFFHLTVNHGLAAISLSAFLIFFNIMFFKGWTQSDLFSGIEETKKYQSSTLSEEEAEKYLRILNRYIEKVRPFLDPELTLKKLSESVNIPSRHLSQLINENIGTNFYDFINSFRIETAKKLLIISEKEKTVSEILYEVGFNSKSSFNTAFKKDTGLTPTEFRKEKKL
jgi:AraC-like DNA-binding protein